jgi:hypothetical protein
LGRTRRRRTVGVVGRRVAGAHAAGGGGRGLMQLRYSRQCAATAKGGRKCQLGLEALPGGKEGTAARPVRRCASGEAEFGRVRSKWRV